MAADHPTSGPVQYELERLEPDPNRCAGCGCDRASGYRCAATCPTPDAFPVPAPAPCLCTAPDCDADHSGMAEEKASAPFPIRCLCGGALCRPAALQCHACYSVGHPGWICHACGETMPGTDGCNHNHLDGQVSQVPCDYCGADGMTECCEQCPRPDGTIRKFTPCPAHRADFLAVMDKIREGLAAEGVTIDFAKWERCEEPDFPPVTAAEAAEDAAWRAGPTYTIATDSPPLPPGALVSEPGAVIHLGPRCEDCGNDPCGCRAWMPDIAPLEGPRVTDPLALVAEAHTREQLRLAGELAAVKARLAELVAVIEGERWLWNEWNGQRLVDAARKARG